MFSPAFGLFGFFLQVLLVPCSAYSTFHVSLGHILFSLLTSFCWRRSYMYFTLLGRFCFGLFFLALCSPVRLRRLFPFRLRYLLRSIRFREPILFPRKYLLFVYTVRDRSAPGAGFVRNELFCAYGPGPFCSGNLFFLERNIIVYAVWDHSAPGAGIAHAYGLGPFRSGSRFVFGRELFVNMLWDTFDFGSRFYSANLLLYGLKPLIWFWHIVDSGSSALGDQK